MSSIVALLLIGMTIIMPVIIIVMIIMSFQGLIEPAPIDALFLLIALSAILLVAAGFFIRNIFPVIFGKQSVSIDENHLSITYRLFGWVTEVKINRAFNPLIQVLWDKLAVVIPGNDAQPIYIHYLLKVPFASQS